MLNLTQRMGEGQEAKYSAPNSQGTYTGKEAKAEGRSGATSQPPRGAASTQQTVEKAERLRVGVE
jgi:hypothetical protein